MMSLTPCQSMEQRLAAIRTRTDRPVSVDVLLLTKAQSDDDLAPSGSDPGKRPSDGCPNAGPLSDNLGRAFLNVAECRAGHPAIVTAARPFSYAWLASAAKRVRDELCALRRFRPGDRVVLSAGNSPEYVAAFYGVLLAGGVVVPVPPDVESHRLEHIIRVCTANVLLSVAEVYERRTQLSTRIARDLPLQRTRDSASHDHEEAEPVTRGVDPRSDRCGSSAAGELAVILFTSGSSGTPKGVMLSHRNLLANAWMIDEYLQIQSDDRALMILPFYHAFGNSILQTHMLRGATLILAGSLTFPNSIPAALDKYRATSFSGVPEVYQRLLTRSSLGRHEVPSLRSMTVAGGAMPPEDAQEIARRIAPAKFYVMYGQTEATARLSYLRPELLTERPGSIGKGLDGVTLEVVDERGQRVAPGERGEIRARGANVMLGYWRDPQTTSRTIQDGWLYTGDMGTVDEEGFLYPQGRSSALLKVEGFRVHPREVEEFVVRHVQDVRAVVVPCALDEGRTRLALFLEPQNRGTAMDLGEIQRICRDGLPRHLVPRYVEILDRFPLTDSLKLDLRGLAQRATERSRSSTVTTASGTRQRPRRVEWLGTNPAPFTVRQKQQ
ncbi:MAG: class I adenylate-forming enzyme family protein [Planctomycetaceae bacterium]